MKQLVEIMKTWARVVTLLRQAAPVLSLIVVVVTLIEAVSGIATLYLVKLLVDSVSSNTSTLQAASFDRTFPILVVTGGAVFAGVLAQNAGSILRMRQGMAVSEFVDRKIHDRAIAVDLAFYESPRYYDDLQQARHGGAQRPAQVVSNVVLALRALVLLTGILVLLAGIEPLLLPILLVPVFIALLVRLFYTRKLFDWRMKRSQLERRVTYLDWLLTSANHAKELRLNRIGAFLQGQYRDLKAQSQNGQIAIEQSRLAIESVMALIGAIILVFATAWLLQQSLAMQRPVGDVVLFVLLLRRAESAGSELVGNTSKIVDDHLYLGRLFKFLEIRPLVMSPAQPAALPNPIAEGIQLSDVSFRYPGAQEFALRNVSLKIRPGQIVALVGENGSGKTTLIKLLTRLHDPTQGAVMLDGVDVRQFEPVEFRALFSAIFQDFATYADTAGNNIRFGDVNLPDDLAAIRQAATQAGASSFIERLPKSFETPLSKLFDDGQDLSIGQWQRLALARAIYPASHFLILDEPTSAVDPKAEFELFQNFRQRIGGRSALVISHRLSTVRQADYIYVLRNGRISEQGSHDDLIHAGGSYADLFEKQAQNYR